MPGVGNLISHAVMNWANEAVFHFLINILLILFWCPQSYAHDILCKAFEELDIFLPSQPGMENRYMMITI